MKNFWKKLSAIVLVVAMVMSLSSVAMAAADDTYTGDSKTTVTADTAGGTIPLVKSIVFTNANGSKVYEPNITFEYTVSPATEVTDGTQTVTDKDNKVAHVYKGPEQGVTGTTISFTSAKEAVSTSNTGVEVEETGNLTVDISKFTHAGIYRYVITEKAIDVTEKGLTARNDNYTNTRYLDVYIKNGTSGLEMYGAVIFKSSNAGKEDINTEYKKTTGFEPSVEDNLKADTDVDQYVTYDIEVEKKVAGSLGDKTHPFPFYASITNTIKGAKYTYTPVGGTAAAEVIPDSATIVKGTDNKNSDLTLTDSQSFKFVGVPSAQESSDLSIAIKEYNDTYDAYTVTVKAENDATEEANKISVTGTPMDALKGSATLSTFDIKAYDSANQKITVTNTLDEISPTGVVLRVAPYALILGAGIALLLISRKRKATEEE